MTPFYADDWLTVYQGDCRAVLAELPAESVHCVVTSPPYWGLRDYGTATWEGGEADCAHAVPATGSTQNKGNNDRQGAPFRGVCGRCSARRVDSQLGLEPTPEAYVANMVAVFREVRRVLRKDGTLWLNLGDSYAGGGTTGRGDADTIRAIDAESGRRPNAMSYGDNDRGGRSPRPRASSLKPKDLCGIPWRVAFALQADGWYLRSDIIWAKPNPMPESVTDRPTKSHEYLFLLSKSATYYYDADAVREPYNAATLSRYDYQFQASTSPGRRQPDNKDERYKERRDGEPNPAGRNIRSVWTIATQPYPGAHFATFPEELPERCIKAGTSERGVCPECRSPWVRVIERDNPRLTDPAYVARSATPNMATADDDVRRNDYGTTATGLAKPGWRELPAASSKTTGWRSTCTCNKVTEESPTSLERWEFTEPVPAVVLDPFAGSGTVGQVAQRLSRRAILIDLNGEYLRQTLVRNRDIPLGLVEGPAA